MLSTSAVLNYLPFAWK